MRRKLNDSAAQPVPIYFVSAADGKTPVNSPANARIRLCKNAGLWTTSGNGVAPQPLGAEPGWHWWTPAAADLGVLGAVAAVALADACDPFPFVLTVEPSTVAEDWARIRLIGTTVGRETGTVLQGGDLEFFVGEDLTAELGRAVEFDVSLPFDATAAGMVWTLGIGPLNGAAIFSATGAAALLEGTTYRLTFEPGNEKTAEADPFAEYGYTAVCTTAAGKVSARVEGIAKARRLWV